MKKSAPLHIQESNLSTAWAKSFIELTDPEIRELTPLTVSITDLNNNDIPEIPEIRAMLDNSLEKTKKELSCHTVANTIFPQSMWDPTKPAEELFKRYKRIQPRIKKYRTPTGFSANMYGVYFQRLIDYRTEAGSESQNQLAYIIETFVNKGNRRRSALQASIYNPQKDATHQRMRGFPCLQQVGFIPIKNSSNLNLVAYYPTQTIYNKAYGNYLGLCRLGQFMAKEMGLELTQMTCFIGVGALSTSKIDQNEISFLRENCIDILNSLPNKDNDGKNNRC